MIAFLKGEPHPDRAREEAEDAARAAAAAAAAGSNEPTQFRNDW
jgi:hypothetical protein